jgi:hypothetical protein
MNRTRTLTIPIFEDVEVLDFCGPFEVFSVANRFTDLPGFNVFTVAEKPGPVLSLRRRRHLAPTSASGSAFARGRRCLPGGRLVP